MPISFAALSGGGGIKTVQRGVAATAGTITISAVNLSKSFVNIYGTASSGVVSVSGTVNAPSGNVSATTMSRVRVAGNSPAGSWTFASAGNMPESGFFVPIRARSLSANATSISGGSTNLVAAVVQGHLSGSTSLVVSGPCRWEVVEFN